jgi:hypothetical protein
MTDYKEKIGRKGMRDEGDIPVLRILVGSSNSVGFMVSRYEQQRGYK